MSDVRELDLLQKRKHEPHVALLMAGGKSERMRAGGCEIHKALRLNNGRTLLEQNLESLFAFGFTDVAVAVNQSETNLVSAIGDLHSLAARRAATLRILIEDEPLGTFGAAALMRDYTDDLLVVNVDNLTDLNLRTFFQFHRESKATLTVACHTELFRIPYGELEICESRVLACKEKPAFRVIVSSGIYALNRRAMMAMQLGEKTQAPDLMNSLIADGASVKCFQHNARWIDINDEAALKQAESVFVLPSVLSASA